jgi:hypothetical protein
LRTFVFFVVKAWVSPAATAEFTALPSVPSAACAVLAPLQKGQKINVDFAREACDKPLHSQAKTLGTKNNNNQPP